MFRDKMKGFGSIMLAFVFLTGMLALSSTSVAFAATQSAKPSSQPVQTGQQVQGWCNYDNDYDMDDWCWNTANGVVPYGTIIGQQDPNQDYNGAYGYSVPYNYGMYGYGRRFYLYPGFRFFRNEERREGLQEPFEVVPRGFRVFRNGTFMTIPPWWMR